jgi:F-type H+-transporting ATPase subunit b
LFEAANFLILVAALGWFFFRPVRAALADRRAQMQEQQRAAAESLARAKQLEEELKRQRAAIQQESEQIRAAARDQARREAEAILEEARRAADKLRRAAEARLVDLERAHADRLAQVVAEATCILTSRLLQQIDGPKLERALFDAALSELKRDQAAKSSSLVVESACPLDDQQKAELSAAVEAAAGGLEFRVNPALIAGVRLTTSAGLIDVSVAGLAQGIQQTLAGQLKQCSNGDARA